MYGSITDYGTTRLHSFRDLAMNQGDQDRSNEIPPRCSDDSPTMGQGVYDTARVQRTSQVAFISDRLDQGLSPATVAGVAAVIAQMESQIQAPMLTISITSGFPGFQRSMTFQDGVWSGHDLTHHFTDDCAAISYSPANGGVHQTRSMQMPTCQHPLKRPWLPVHLISRKQRCWKHPCFLRHHQVNLVNHKDCCNHHHLHNLHHVNRWHNEQFPNHHLQSNRKRSLQSVIKARPKHKEPSKMSWTTLSWSESDQQRTDGYPTQKTGHPTPDKENFHQTTNLLKPNAEH